MIEYSSSEFKAKCLGIIDEVHDSGGRVVITKRGKRVAELVRYTDIEDGYPQESLRGTAHIDGDIESPPVDPAVWRSAGNA